MFPFRLPAIETHALYHISSKSVSQQTDFGTRAHLNNSPRSPLVRTYGLRHSRQHLVTRWRWGSSPNRKPRNRLRRTWRAIGRNTLHASIGPSPEYNVGGLPVPGPKDDFSNCLPCPAKRVSVYSAVKKLCCPTQRCSHSSIRGTLRVIYSGRPDARVSRDARDDLILRTPEMMPQASTRK